MKWELLKNFQCPKCGATLKDGILYKCIAGDFMISKGKFIELTGKGKVKTMNQRTKLLIKQKIPPKYKFINKKKGIWNIPDNF